MYSFRRRTKVSMLDGGIPQTQTPNVVASPASCNDTSDLGAVLALASAGIDMAVAMAARMMWRTVTPF
jgi:hypothetical protein